VTGPNGDYIYGKRKLREIDRRIRYLSKSLDRAVVVDNSGKTHERCISARPSPSSTRPVTSARAPSWAWTRDPNLSLREATLTLTSLHSTATIRLDAASVISAIAEDLRVTAMP
jgi:hypothetical protein